MKGVRTSPRTLLIVPSPPNDPSVLTNGLHGPAKSANRLEVRRSSDPIGVVVGSARTSTKGFGRRRGLEYLPAQFRRNDIVLVCRG